MRSVETAAAVRFPRFSPFVTNNQVFTHVDTSTNQQTRSRVSMRNEIGYNSFDADNMFPNAGLCSNDCSEDAEVRCGAARQVLSVVQQCQ